MVSFFLALALAVVIFILAGSYYETLSRQRELSQVKPPGRMVQVNNHRLHIDCQGERLPGQPTVILEAGAGGWSLHWYDFQQRAAVFARVCAYDRAGFGWSDSGPAPRDGQQIVQDLHALLAAAGEKSPYVLVGASRGGQYVRLYRDAYPDEVVGLVLVDAEPEDFRQNSPVVQSLASQNQVMFSAVGWLTRIGFFRLLGGDPAKAPQVPCVPFMVDTLPPAARAAYLAVEGQQKCFDALLAEEAATSQREAQLRKTAGLGDLPLVVLTHGLPGAAPNGVSAEQAAQVEQLWQGLQAKLATLSSRGQLVHAERSGHNIALDQPGLVLDAIRPMVGRQAVP